MPTEHAELAEPHRMRDEAQQAREVAAAARSQVETARQAVQRAEQRVLTTERRAAKLQETGADVRGDGDASPDRDQAQGLLRHKVGWAKDAQLLRDHPDALVAQVAESAGCSTGAATAGPAPGTRGPSVRRALGNP